jgi:uncharacterized protein involved in outer membrane biogenesis
LKKFCGGYEPGQRKPMKLRIKILILSIISLTIVFSASYLLLAIKGRDVFIKKLGELTGKKVTLSAFQLTPFLTLQINDLQIEGLAKAERVNITPSIPYLLFGNIALNNVRITRPEINIERFPNKPKEAAAAQGLQAAQGLPAPAPVPGSGQTIPAPVVKRLPYIICKNIVISDGKVNFIDHTAGESGITIVIKDISFRLSNFYTLPFSGVTSFDFKGRIPWNKDQEEGKISFQGWLNFFKKDIQAKLKIEDIDGVYLYPYYSNSGVDLEKARIEKAKLYFSSDIRGLNNNVTVKCRLELSDIVRRPLETGEGDEKAAKITDNLIGTFKALDQGKIVLDFNIRTRLDRPEFGFDNIKSAFETKVNNTRGKAKVQDVVAFSGRMFDSAMQSARDLFKAVVSATMALGKEIKKSLKAVMGRK